jgi:peptide/nickel transport system substrate-binding protein
MNARWISIVIAGCVLAGCAAPEAPRASQNNEARGQSPATTKRIVGAIPNEPVMLYYGLAPTSTRGGQGILQDLLHPGLVVRDNQNELRPLLVEAVPSVENGLWTLFPDGRMETTWQIKPGVTWHDGTPLTSDDLVFTLEIVRDRELAALRNRNYDLIDSVANPDPRTITVSWSRTFINADQLFTVPLALPVPKHLLEEAFRTDKATLTEHPYWTDEYVGLGPYRLGEWVRGSHVIVHAYDRYVYGRPKIDEVEFRTIQDPNTLMSNMLSGTIHLWRGAFLGVDQGIEMRDRWRDGDVHIILNNWVAIYPQHLNANPAIVQNPQFRRALLHAIDRQQMADSLMAGLVPVAHGPFNPNTREYRETQASLVRYDYDPARAVQLIEELGYTRGQDGALRDAQGQRLATTMHGTAHREIVPKSLFPVANYWEQIGIAAEPIIIPTHRASDLQEQATFPAFLLVRQGYGWDRVWSYHTNEARVPERNFRGRNNGRYMNPALDALIDRFWVTIPWNERIQVTSQILHHMTDQLPVMPLFYDMDIALVAKRIQNIEPFLGGEATSQAWNAYEWDVR